MQVCMIVCENWHYTPRQAWQCLGWSASSTNILLVESNLQQSHMVIKTVDNTWCQNTSDMEQCNQALTDNIPNSQLEFDWWKGEHRGTVHHLALKHDLAFIATCTEGKHPNCRYCENQTALIQMHLYQSKDHSYTCVRAEVTITSKEYVCMHCVSNAAH